ncbi:hypothetical protein [Nocardia sp. X0981]
MGFWDGVGDFFSEYGDDILVGAASVAGFALGAPFGAAPLGAALLGGAANGISAAVKGENVLAGIALGMGSGLLGGVGSFGVKGALFAKSSLNRLSGLTTEQAAKAAANRGALGVIPSRIGGAHIAPWKSYMGLLGAATVPMTASYIQGAYYRNFGYPAIPLIDISPEEIDEIPDGMPHIWMPKPDEMPEGLVFTEPMQRNYRTLPDSYLGFWQSFGTKPAKPELPEELEVSDISGEEASNIPSYVERVQLLNESYLRLRGYTEVVATAVERSGELRDAGRKDLSRSIEGLKEFAAADPRDAKRLGALLEEYAEKTSEYAAKQGNVEVWPFMIDPQLLNAGLAGEDDYAMLLIESALGCSEGVMGFYAEQFLTLAEEIAQKEPPAETTPENERDTPKSGNKNEKDTDDPVFGGPEDEKTDDTGNGDDAGVRSVAPPEPWDLTAGAVPADDSEPGARAGTRTETGSVNNPFGTTALGDSARVSPIGAGGTAPTAPGGLMGGSDLTSALGAMLLPRLIQSLLARHGAAGEDDRKRDRNEGQRPPGAVVTASSQAGAGAPQSTTTTPSKATAPQAAPSKPVSAPETTTPPPRRAVAPDWKDTMVYTFPDGRSQEVSVVVARALDAAFGNAAGTDARAAYTGTPIEWTDEKRIGERKSPFEAVTGDVGVWADRTALLVKIDTGSGGEDVLEAVVDGALVKIIDLDRMHDGAGGFGAFVGAFHPPGIERAAAPGSAVFTSSGTAEQVGAVG